MKIGEIINSFIAERETKISEFSYIHRDYKSHLNLYESNINLIRVNSYEMFNCIFLETIYIRRICYFCTE